MEPFTFYVSPTHRLIRSIRSLQISVSFLQSTSWAFRRLSEPEEGPSHLTKSVSGNLCLINENSMTYQSELIYRTWLYAYPSSSTILLFGLCIFSTGQPTLPPILLWVPEVILSLTLTSTWKPITTHWHGSLRWVWRNLGVLHVKIYTWPFTHNPPRVSRESCWEIWSNSAVSCRSTPRNWTWCPRSTPSGTLSWIWRSWASSRHPELALRWDMGSCTVPVSCTSLRST